MGLTCANIHVFIGGRHAHLQPADVGRVIDEACDRIGYEPIERDSPVESDLLAVAAESWVSVLDPRSPGIITEALAKLAGQLSAAAGCPVLAASVYDSDEFAFLVFEGGDPVDGYATQDDLLPLSFNTRSANERAQLWNRLFGRSLDGKDVGELAQPPGLFADDQLAALCRLVGIPLEHGTLKASDLDQPTALTTRGYRLRSTAVTVDGDASVTPMALSPVFRVAVTAPKWIPLHCESYIRSREPHPQLLPHALSASREGIRLLNTPEILSGVAILTDRGERQFAPIPGLLEPWLTFLAVEEPYHVQAVYEGQMHPRTFHIPRKKQALRPEEIGAGKKWQKLFAKPSAIQSLFFQVARDQDETVVAGASVQRTCEDDDVAGTIHLAFWRRCVPDHAREEADRDTWQHLTSLIDSAFETMAGLQGWIAHWDWIPRFSMGEENSYTPYEDAYALDSPGREPAGASGGYMDEKWCRRYLRGLSEQLWLGSPLLERIDRGRVAEIATAKEVGVASARFDLVAGVELSQLEELLLPILPMSIDGGAE